MAFLLQDLISKNAEKNPDSLMIQDGDKIITYGEMEIFSNKFSKFLVSCGVKRGDIIAFYMEKSINSFKSIISILKADCVYEPLNLMTPNERVNFILKDSGCKFLICDSQSYNKTLDLLSTFEGNIRIINIDIENLDNFDNKKRDYENIDDDLAYIIYTSGSTGFPKGVMITHKNVMDYASWTVDFFKITNEDRLSNHPSLYFDLSTFDLYTAFKSGASLHLVPKSISMFPIRIIEFIEENKLTLWNSVPSLLTFIAKSGVLTKGRMPSLKNITFCGEVMPTQTMIDWMNIYPEIRYVNQYGPTETTCASMFYEIKDIPEDPTIPIPIGKAIPNTGVFALNEHKSKIKVGEIGELYIRGAGNGKGYWNDYEKTKRSFVKNPLNPNLDEKVYATGDLVKMKKDKNYDFVGRKDNQIKYMGFRIELGEIDSTLNSFDYVSSCVALGIDSVEISRKIIVAFVCLKKDVDSLKIKEDLMKKIPHYMVPKKIVFLEKMPLNENGKIDKLALSHINLYKNQK